MNTLTEFINVNSLLHSLGYLAIVFVLFFIGKILYNTLNATTLVNHELVEKDNFAFSIAYVGYFSAITIILIAAISGESYGFIEDAKLIGIYSILGMFLLHVSILVSNKLMLPKFSIKKEILQDRNEGTGIIEAAIYIGNAFLLYGALIGEASSLTEGLITFVGYWFIGNIMLIISTKIFSWWIGYDIHDQIEKDNVAAGIAFAGAVISISIVIMNAMIEPFTDLQTSVIEILTYTLLGIIILPVMRLVSDKILLPGQRLTDEIINQSKPNLGAALVEAFAYIGAAIFILCTF
ncbi:DUF350 domain-containing protein [Aquimarina agarivorans]|uniref:DUF350 domain-containing protein n=1 Tax=Aquimarina agarivorans TaxID=980584 RepID=UPI000248F26C|nr:DUF350 domain-containing protein [Aquimarina agarivorans]